jgi:hypothetical protein
MTLDVDPSGVSESRENPGPGRHHAKSGSRSELGCGVSGRGKAGGGAQCRRVGWQGTVGIQPWPSLGSWSGWPELSVCMGVSLVAGRGRHSHRPGLSAVLLCSAGRQGPAPMWSHPAPVPAYYPDPVDPVLPVILALPPIPPSPPKTSQAPTCLLPPT